MYWDCSEHYPNDFVANKINKITKTRDCLIFDIENMKDKKIVDCDTEKKAKRFVEEFMAGKLNQVIGESYIESKITQYDLADNIDNLIENELGS
jgi:hypothetical protein